MARKDINFGKGAGKNIYVPDLIADMAECDANYIRLHRLFPDMASEDELRFGVRVGRKEAAVVAIRVLQRCPFTTMMAVNISPEKSKPFIKWPSMELRVYHDVKSAEIFRFERHRNFRSRYATPNEYMFQPDEKSQINRFFGELLTHCIQHGYSLEPVC